MSQLQSKENQLRTQLPTAPEDGEVYVLPEGTNAGGASVVSIYHGADFIGTCQHLTPMTNVSGMFYLERASLKKVLKPRDVIRIKAESYTFSSIKFVNFFGWVGEEVSPQVFTAFDEFLKVRNVVPVGPQTDGFHVYERVFLEILKGAKK